jgi:DNA-binding transcriptional MocR family regulator
LQSNDQSGLVLHVGSFSKSLMPGIRIGYIAATPQLISRLVATKQANDLCSPPLLQRALAIFLQRGGFAAHLRRVIPRYRERRDALLAALSHSFPSHVRWTTPRGGFCSWVALPPGVSVTDLYLAAINRGVAFTPGDVFFSSPTVRPFLRLAFSIQPPAAIDESVRILGDLLYSHLHRRSTNPFTTADCVPLV